jgi:hypothetical protein
MNDTADLEWLQTIVPRIEALPRYTQDWLVSRLSNPHRCARYTTKGTLCLGRAKWRATQRGEKPWLLCERHAVEAARWARRDLRLVSLAYAAGNAG